MGFSGAQRRILVLTFGAWLFAILPCQAQTQCPELPTIPKPSTEADATQKPGPVVDAPYHVMHAVDWQREPFLGVGHLPIERRDARYYDWPSWVVLPLWAAPNASAFAGWIYDGQVALAGASSVPLTGAGMVETDYEHSTLFVHATAPGGWLHIQWGAGAEDLAWTHRCHLELGEARLAYEPWEEFLRRHGDWMHFRSRVPHALREAPSVESPRVTWIGLDHKLILREISGDWMRVEVQQPDPTCGSSDTAFAGATDTGWVKWRDPEMGPWVWIYTRGC